MKNECFWGVDIEFKILMRKAKSLLKQTTPLQICSAPLLNSPEYAYIYRLNIKIYKFNMLCLSGFELYSRWVPLLNFSFFSNVKTQLESARW